jgi:RHH-type proline utilization regulon transcriptional repressor/proline dehydrogenase/delta 1-pyrroline-5-carboxylate dehydrogenase
MLTLFGRWSGMRTRETSREVLHDTGEERKSSEPLEPQPAGRQAERFRNEPYTDFTRAGEREKLRTAILDLRRQLSRRYPLVINHKPVSTDHWLPSLNPANQHEVVGFAAQGAVAHAESALAAARGAQPLWARTPPAERAALLERVAALLRRDKAGLSALETLEAGKNWTEADADVAEAIDFCNFYAAVMRELGEPQRTQAVAGESDFQHWWPRGVGVVIAPWNFPLAILTGMTAAAVVAGNTVIMKPSDQTPILGARLMELFISAGLPSGVVNLLTGPGGTIGGGIGLEQDASMSQSLCGGLTGGDEVLQILAFLGGQGDLVLLHGAS